MQVLDTHLHLDDHISGPAVNAARELSGQLEDANIQRAVVLHLQTQRWPVEEVAEAIRRFPRLRGFVNVHPLEPNAIEALERGVKELGFIGLKLHPRLQEYSVDVPELRKLVRHAGSIQVPVLIDAFPDGTFLQQGFSPLAYARLAADCPDTRIIIAHMGGHHVLDFMMLGKRLPNVYFDLSYSLLYFRGSSVPQNMAYAMKSMKYDRIFYGSDYPDRTIKETLEGSLAELSKLEVADTAIQKIFWQNAKEFFQWNDL